jgi:hypothetical protein
LDPSAKSKMTGRGTALGSAALVLVLTFAALSLGGCPALLIPGLAYQGYKMTHHESTATTSRSQGRSTSQSRSSVAADHSIE